MAGPIISGLLSACVLTVLYFLGRKFDKRIQVETSISAWYNEHIYSEMMEKFNYSYSNILSVYNEIVRCVQEQVPIDDAAVIDSVKQETESIQLLLMEMSILLSDQSRQTIMVEVSEELDSLVLQTEKLASNGEIQDAIRRVYSVQTHIKKSLFEPILSPDKLNIHTRIKYNYVDSQFMLFVALILCAIFSLIVNIYYISKAISC